MIVSLEMPAAKIFRRLVSGITGINSTLIREGKLTPAQEIEFTEGCNELNRRLGDRLKILDRLRSDIRYILATR